MAYEELRKELVEQLCREGYIRSTSVRNAFLSVYRENFVPEQLKGFSYDDRPLPIGEGQTISAPSMIAIMLEESDLHKGMKVLEIGTGSGYNACLLGNIVGDNNVTTIERFSDLCEAARGRLDSCNIKIEVICGDGTLGYHPNSPYDRIIITAAAPDFPTPLIEQLKVSGKIIAPIGKSGMVQRLKIGTKKDGSKLSIDSKGHCVFVPLIGEYGF